MATLTSFRAGGVCAVCGAYGRVWVLSDFGGRGATYTIGDDVRGDVGDDFVTHSLLVRTPAPDEAARVLATWTCETCGRCNLAEVAFADGWLVGLRPVELTSSTLDQIHYVATYDAGEWEGLIGRSIWDEHGVWSGWLTALRAAAAGADVTTHGIAADQEFPLGGRLDCGRLQIVEHYLGGGYDQLWFARSTSPHAARYLVCTTIDNGFDVATDSPKLLRPAPGAFRATFIGGFDTEGREGADAEERRSTLAYVEEVPAGWPLALAGIPVGRAAFDVGAQIARKLLMVEPSALDPGLRPEYVWMANRPSGPVVTGFGGRCRDFLLAATRRRDLITVPLFTRHYVAPEVHRGAAADQRSLVFTLGVMTVEWLLGRYPYDDGDGAYGYNRLCRGEHVPLPLEAVELGQALRPDPAGRPSLADFERLLTRLARAA